MNRSVGLRA